MLNRRKMLGASLGAAAAAPQMAQAAAGQIGARPYYASLGANAAGVNEYVPEEDFRNLLSLRQGISRDATLQEMRDGAFYGEPLDLTAMKSMSPAARAYIAKERYIALDMDRSRRRIDAQIEQMKKRYPVLAAIAEVIK